jgi:hypothetical protein
MPATKIPVLTLSVIAAGAILEGQAVGFDRQAAQAGNPMLGIATHDASSGEPLAVDVIGTSIGIAAGTVLFEGARLRVGASARLEVINDASTEVPVARALQTASSAGQRFEVLILSATAAPAAG